MVNEEDNLQHIPTKKEEITVNKYVKFDEVMNNPDTQDHFKLHIKIEILTGIPFVHVSQLK